MAQLADMYVRIEKVGSVEIPDGMSYEEALDYANQQDSEGLVYFDLYIDVCDQDGEVVNEAGWEE